MISVIRLVAVNEEQPPDAGVLQETFSPGIERSLKNTHGRHSHRGFHVRRSPISEQIFYDGSLVIDAVLGLNVPVGDRDGMPRGR
jgi:hypothetical protein